MKHLILGVGEIGSAYHSILSRNCEVYRKDILPERTDKKIPKRIDVLHVCLRHSDEFVRNVLEAIDYHQPAIINNMTTCPPGTTVRLRPDACHSTTRGLHPSLMDWILSGTKHIGGEKASRLAGIFRGAGVKCEIHDKAVTTELLHIASNFTYGAELMAADEVEKLCRHYNVDFPDFLRYQQTHNDGYAALGLKSKFRAVVTPPHGNVGGHCVTQGANLIPADIRGPLMERLSKYSK